MANVELVNLPEEVLIKIFLYINSRFQLSSTCKIFYKICCRLEINKFAAKINEESILKDKIFNSIINSSREFDELHLVNIKSKKSFARVLQILKVYGDKIRNLRLATVALSESELINLLNELRSLNEIVVKSISIRSLDNRYDDTRIKETSNKTKSIEIKTSVKNVFLDQHCDRKILSILNHLPADSIEKLALRFPTNDMKLLQTFLCKQNQLKQLTIYTNFIQSISISHLHLTHLTIEARRISIDTIQSQQNQCLEYLCIMNFPLNDRDVLEEIFNLTSLKVLKIYIGNISSDNIGSVSRLDNLEELTVKCAAKYDEEGQLTMFCSMKMSALVKLELLIPNLKLNDDDLRMLGVSLGHQLRTLKIEKISLENFFTIVDCFCQIENLDACLYDESTKNFNYHRIDHLKHYYLKTLSIRSSIYDTDISSLLCFFPNLQKFIVNKKKIALD